MGTLQGTIATIMDLEELTLVMEQFPRLRAEGVSKTSDKDPNQNCIGFALGIRQWWESGSGCTWIKGIPDDTIPGWLEIFVRNGFVIADDAALEFGVEKIAIYANSG